MIFTTTTCTHLSFPEHGPLLPPAKAVILLTQRSIFRLYRSLCQHHCESYIARASTQPGVLAFWSAPYRSHKILSTSNLPDNFLKFFFTTACHTTYLGELTNSFGTPSNRQYLVSVLLATNNLYW
jgi:hypothetical protein